MGGAFSSSGFSSPSAAASSTSTSSSSATGRAWRTGSPSPTLPSTPPSPWWSSPSPRSAGPPRVALSMTMEHRQHTKLEKIFYNFFTICQSYISCLLKFSKYTKQNLPLNKKKKKKKKNPPKKKKKKKKKKKS